MSYEIEKKKKFNIKNLIVNNKILIILLFFALFLRVGRLFIVNNIDKDSVAYIYMAKEWNQNGAEHAFDLNPRIPPLYIFLMACGESLGVDAQYAGQIISILAGAFLPLAVFLIAFYLFKNKMWALFATFLAALHPPLVRMSIEIMRDSLSVTLFTFAVAFIILGIDNQKKTSYLFYSTAGIFTALATMTRSEGFEIIPIFTIFVFIEALIHFKDIEFILKRCVLPFLCLIITFSVISFPVQYMLKDSTSAWRVIDPRITGMVERFLHGDREEQEK